MANTNNNPTETTQAPARIYAQVMLELNAAADAERAAYRNLRKSEGTDAETYEAARASWEAACDVVNALSDERSEIWRASRPA